MVKAIGGALEYNGRYFARYKENGKRKQIYGRNAEDVLIKRQELIDKLNKQLKDSMNDKNETADSTINENSDGYDVLPEDNVTLGKWLTDWLETHIKLNKCTSTYKGYKVFVTKHIIPSMGNVKINELTPDLIQVFLNTKLTGGKLNGTVGGMSPQSMSNMRFMMKSALDIAVKDRLISYNPMDLVNVIRVARKEKRALTHEEEKKLVETCNESNKIIIYGVVIALRLGLDIGELLALKWSDIDFEHNQVYVRRAIKRVTSEDESSGKKTALQLIETNTVRMIQKQALRGEFITDMKNLKDKYVSSIGFVPDTVIASSNGLPVDPSYYSRLYKKFFDLAGMPNDNFDILKNTFVVRLFEMGFDSSDIQKISGYSETSRPLKRLKDIACNKAFNEQPVCANE